jgi:hypothetical protein
MGNVTKGLPLGLCRVLREIADVDCLVETGTNLGDTAEWAAAHFARVVTIEAFAPLYQRASARLATFANVETRFGTSQNCLPEVVASLKAPALFWLDAHWSGEGTAGADNECPLITEIHAIDNGPHQHIILIDDARLFMQPPPRPHDASGWPTIGETLDALRKSNADSFVCIIDDVIVRVPSHMRTALSDAIRDGRTAATQKPAAFQGVVKTTRRWLRSRV